VHFATLLDTDRWAEEQALARLSGLFGGDATGQIHGILQSPPMNFFDPTTLVASDRCRYPDEFPSQ
jgi:hypothetical protein